ncbi:TadE/TadG family type IV pilus assembly protein [Sphingomonas montanisoli]|uniref:Pilus assembly protein n=1 Tax=Sphingomonas montanisoli TaxID=2606412 RepID=A0A5D9CDM6_9SPHN|nr:TadE/TadG family type IV pilus assembly protein [Sphingomonas montanisoli]TZG29437.1 pilus assembly protein [Sphingomonas montanisoli]
MRRAIRSDARGAAAIEFALVVPFLLLLIMGLCELAYQGYIRAILTGAVEKAGRDSTIQGADIDTIDDQVLTQVQQAAPRASFSTGFPLRKSYTKFGYIQPEPFTDLNGDGVRQTGECYTDINNNKSWDADPGSNGAGGASDSVVYTVTINYPRLFPLAAWLGWTGRQVLTATTTLKNQPYGTQAVTAPATVCL